MIFYFQNNSILPFSILHSKVQSKTIKIMAQTHFFDIPAEILCPMILEELPSNAIRVFLENSYFSNYIQDVYPSIIEEISIDISDSDHFDNLHDLKLWINSRYVSLTDKIIAILSYEEHFEKPLDKIIETLQNHEGDLIFETLMSFDYPYGEPKTLAPLIKTLVNDMSYDISIEDNVILRKALLKEYNSIVDFIIDEKDLLKQNEMLLVAPWVSYARSIHNPAIANLFIKQKRIDPSTNL